MLQENIVDEYSTARCEKSIFVELKPTYQCNQSCPFCVWNSRKSLKKMTKAEISMNILYINEHIKPKCFILSGGEPLFHPQREFIFSQITSINSIEHFHLHTNATLVSRVSNELLKEIAEERSATIAMHGHTREIHEAITGNKRSFETVIKGIDTLKNNGYRLRASAVLCRLNFPYICELTEFLMDLKFEIVELRIPVTGPNEDINSNFIDHDRMGKVLDEWWEEFGANSNARVISAGALCYGTMALNYSDSYYCFFDKLHQGKTCSMSNSQLTAIWPNVYSEYVKSDCCKKCVLDVICPGYSPAEIKSGYARYVPIGIDTLIGRVPREKNI